MVLAAGLSRRAGSVDKLVARVRDEPLVWHPVRTALYADLSQVVVVTGRAGTGAYAAIERFVASRDGDGLHRERPDLSVVRLVTNPHPERGIASSLRIGVSALGPETVAAVILLGDMPWVQPDTIGALVRAFRAGRDGPVREQPARPLRERPDGAWVPVHGGRRGNPVLWSADFFPALRGREGDQGARNLLVDPATPVHEVRVDDPGVLRDVDTPEDLGRLDEAD